MKRNYKYKLKNTVKDYSREEYKRLYFRAFLSDLRLDTHIRYHAYLMLISSFKKNKNVNKIAYYCISTKQRRGLVKNMNMFRMTFRENASFANFSGIRRSSW